VAVQECDCCGCSLVNLSDVGQAWIVSGHVFEHQVGVAQDDGDVVLQRVLELGRVTHGDHRSIWNDRSRASPTLPADSDPKTGPPRLPHMLSGGRRI
jgi:hypothetical protein